MIQRTSIENEVLQRIRPSTIECDEIRTLCKKLIDTLSEISDVPAMITGSIARDTWIKGDKDIDLFMMYPPDLPIDKLKERGLSEAYSLVSKLGGNAEEKYAEHPYLNAVIDGYNVDIVPCYHISSTSEMKCAVDRTPFHTKYILKHIGSLRDDILLLKQFTKGGGVYGSDHITGGFSGYLCELLIIRYGSFTNLLQTVSTSFKEGEVIDIEGYYQDQKDIRKKFSDDPLIFIDPTDKNRNVAAALTRTQFAEFVSLARNYVQNPNLKYFIPDKQTKITKSEFNEILSNRDTELLAIKFNTPKLVEDVIVPQLRKSMNSIRSILESLDFQIHRSDTYMGSEHSLILFEFTVSKLPQIMIHYGPTIWNYENSDKFIDKHINPENKHLSGPWIDNGRYYTEIPRKYTTAKSVLLDKNKILSGSIGKHVRITLETTGYEVLSGSEIWSDEFSLFISSYFNYSSQSIRKLRSI